MPPEDVPAADLGSLIARFLKVSTRARSQKLRDGEATVRQTMEKLFKLDRELAVWEESLDGHWRYKTQHAPHLPPAAVFDGEHHIYYDMWVARIWNYYRWARILVNQVVLEMASRYPKSGSSMSEEIARKDRLKIITKESRDTLVSTPCHWRHPLLKGRMPESVEQLGGGRAGSAGLPILLFQLKVAGCAPGVPRNYWEWTYGIMNCIWGDMGMLHAKNMMDIMDAADAASTHEAETVTSKKTSRSK